MAFQFRRKAKNRFSRWRPWRPSWISDRHDFSYFWSTSHPDASYQVSSQLAQGCRNSRLLKQLLTQHDRRHTTHDRDWLTTLAHHEHFVLRWANDQDCNYYNFHFIFDSETIASPLGFNSNHPGTSIHAISCWQKSVRFCKFLGGDLMKFCEIFMKITFKLT